MSVIDSIIKNTYATDSPKSQGGVGTTPLNNDFELKMECRIAFDYLSITFPYSFLNQSYWQKVEELFFLKNIPGNHFPFGRNGYSNSIQWKNELNQDKETFTILYTDGSSSTNNKYDEKTAQLELTGDGCRALESRGGDLFPEHWRTIFNNLVLNSDLNHLNISRFDFAIDVFNAEFTLMDIKKALINHNLLTPFQHYDHSVGGEIQSDDIDLHIIDLGSKNSKQFLCIYDKKQERENIGKIVDFDSWYRFEFRFKNYKAKNFILNMLNAWDDDNSLGRFASSLILKYCDIKNRPSKGKYSNNSELAPKNTMLSWPTNEKWLKFLGSSEKAKIENYFKYESSITKNANWYMRSVSKTVAKLFLSNPEFFYSFVNNAIVNGIDRIKNDDLAYINKFREFKGVQKLSVGEIKEICEKLKIDISEDLVNNNIDILFDENGELR